MQPSAQHPILSRIRDLLRSTESGIVEFKSGNDNPETIGKLISALSNAARIEEAATACLLWGVEDETKRIVGTSFDPEARKVQGEPLQFWLAKRLKPDLAFQLHTVEDPAGNRLVLLEIPAAPVGAVEFDRTASGSFGTICAPGVGSWRRRGSRGPRTKSSICWT